MSESLSGKYFNLALGFFPGLVHHPLVLKVADSGAAQVVSPPLGFKYDGPLQVVRVIIEKTSAAGKVESRHSNVILIDHRMKRILRFEPMLNSMDPEINRILIETLRPSFKGYDYEESALHPQTRTNGHHLCVAFVIQFVLDYSKGTYGQKDFMNQRVEDIARSVKTIYNLPASVEAQDVEYGFGGAALGLGLLGGLAIGTALAPRPYYSPYYAY